MTRRAPSSAPEDTLSQPGTPFDIAPSMADAADTGTLRMGSFEGLYEELFAEALESGEISAVERERLDLAARSMGLQSSRVARLEAALLRAWESDASETLVDAHGPSHPDPGTLADREPSEQPISTESEEDEASTLSWSRREEETHSSSRRELPRELAFGELHARYQEAARSGAKDDQWRLAEVLIRRNAATPDQNAFWNDHRLPGPIRPVRPLTGEDWTKMLSHPEQDRLTGAIFGVIASATLVGRVSAMRRDGMLPKLGVEGFHDPLSSTVSAVRAVAWAAATMGIRTPPIHVDPDIDVGFEIVTMIPPTTRIGARVLSGLSAAQLAFSCGRHLTWYREEHFICTLVPSLAYLETIFYAALLLGAPTLQLPEDLHARASVFSQAIVPCLEPGQLERLVELVAMFLERGGRTNLKRWARCAEWTACRTGLLLCGDLSRAAEALSGEPGAETRMTELETFWVSDEVAELRRKLGVDLG